MTTFLPTAIGSLDLEDSAVVEVCRSGVSIEICLDRARLVHDGQEGHAAYESIERPVLRLEAFSEQSSKHIGRSGTVPVDDPNMPLDRIEVIEYESGNLILSGYRNHEPWIVWTLSAARITCSTPLWTEAVI